jgi:hypothetical protein
MAFQKKQTQPIIAPMFPGKKLGVFHQVIGENMPMKPNLALSFSSSRASTNPQPSSSFRTGVSWLLKMKKTIPSACSPLSPAGMPAAKHWAWTGFMAGTRSGS